MMPSETTPLVLAESSAHAQPHLLRDASTSIDGRHTLEFASLHVGWPGAAMSTNCGGAQTPGTSPAGAAWGRRSGKGERGQQAALHQDEGDVIQASHGLDGHRPERHNVVVLWRELMSQDLQG